MYVYLDQNGTETLIKHLQRYTNLIGSVGSMVQNMDDDMLNPVDISGSKGSFRTTMEYYETTVQSYVDGLQNRLDAAIAANECGLSKKDSSGRIAYWLPDGESDTMAAAKAYNTDELAKAKSDIETIEKCRKDGSISNKEWEALKKSMEENQDNPVYAQYYMTRYGPNALLDVGNDIQKKTAGDDTGGPNDDRKTSNASVTSGEIDGPLGHMLAVASQEWDDDQAYQFANDLCSYAEDEKKSYRIDSLNTMLGQSRWTDIDGDGQGEAVGLDYNNTFLVNVAARMENFAKTSDGSSDPRPLTGVVHAMTGNPGAADDWMLYSPDGKALSEDDAAKRIQNIARGKDGTVGANQWTEDWARIAYNSSADAGHVRDGLDPLEASRRRAIEVSGALNGIGNEKGHVQYTGGTVNLIADTLKQFPAGVNDTINNAGAGPVEQMQSASDGWQPRFTQTALANLVGEVSQNEGASKRLTDSIDAYNNKAVQEQIATCQNERAQHGGELPSGSDADLKDALNRRATTMGFFAGAGNRSLVRKAQISDEDEAKQDLERSYALGYVPYVGSTANLMLDYDKTNDTKDRTVAEWASENVKSQAQGELQVRNADDLVQSGLYSDEELVAVKNSNGASITDHVLDEEGNVLEYDTSDSQTRGELRTLNGNLRRSDGSFAMGEDADAAFEKGYTAAGPLDEALPTDWQK